jgi:hypothetical protein
MSLSPALVNAGTIGTVGSVLSIANATKAFLSGPKQQDGINGYFFDIPISEQIKLNTQITDHFVEENYAIQDHIAIEPVEITLVGNVAELVYTKSDLEAYLQTVLDRLGPLGALAPGLSSSAQKALSTYNQLNSAVKNVVKQFKNLKGDKAAPTNQSAIYLKFEEWLQNRVIMKVQTPWKTFPSMVLKSVTFDQDAETKDRSEVTIVCKEIRTVKVLTGVGTLVGTQRNAAQKSTPVSQGVTGGSSVLYDMTQSNVTTGPLR